MRPTLIVSSFFMLVLCWLSGAEIASSKVNAANAVAEKPYRAVMREAVAGLREMGVAVAEPAALPPVVVCGACLDQREAFGAYIADKNQVVMPDAFDLATMDGHASLAHEYGHYLLTQAGVPPQRQEKLCLGLGNRAYQVMLTAALNPTNATP